MNEGISKIFLKEMRTCVEENKAWLWEEEWIDLFTKLVQINNTFGF